MCCLLLNASERDQVSPLSVLKVMFIRSVCRHMLFRITECYHGVLYSTDFGAAPAVRRRRSQFAFGFIQSSGRLVDLFLVTDDQQQPHHNGKGKRFDDIYFSFFQLLPHTFVL